jgi:tetratricopeptide (TPR) repeat protein
MPRRICPIWGLVSLVVRLFSPDAGRGATEAPSASSQELDDQERAELDSAIEEYTEAIALEPQDAEAYYLRSIAYTQTGQREDAIADLERALELGLSPDAEQHTEEVLEELGRWPVPERRVPAVSALFLIAFAIASHLTWMCG